MYEHNALGYWSGLALCLTKVRSSRARCPATALIVLLQLRLKDIYYGEILSKTIKKKDKSCNIRRLIEK